MPNPRGDGSRRAESRSRILGAAQCHGNWGAAAPASQNDAAGGERRVGGWALNISWAGFAGRWVMPEGLRGDVVHQPPATGPALATFGSRVLQSDGAALLGFILLSGFCFLSVGKCKHVFPAGRHTGGVTASTTGLTQLVHRPSTASPIYTSIPMN